MSHSLNEIEATAKKASRGSGMSWGLAEEAGRAVRWLASHDMAGVALLAELLQHNDGVDHRSIAPKALDGKWVAPSGKLCPIISGATLNDCADRLASGKPIEMEAVSQPLLAVPFAAWAALHVCRPVIAIWGEVSIASDGYGIWLVGNPGRDGPSDMSFKISDTPKTPPQKPRLRGVVCPDGWKVLNRFAHRTYAPATEASRLLGAGAGVSDND